MTDLDEAPGPLDSVFVKLVAIMVAMAASLLAMVAGFYFFILIPNLHVSMNRLVGQYARAIAASAPDSMTARSLATSLDMDMRYEGPADRSWATDPDVPTLATIGELHPKGLLGHFGFPGRAYYVVHARGGGTYIFERKFGGAIFEAHSKMVLMLLVVMAAVFASTYWVFRRLLRPVRLLNEAVARISEGELDVVVPHASRDEFGTLTRAFNRMAGRVKEMVRARDQLLLDVSHELRSPLTRLKVAHAMLPDGPHRAGMAADLSEMESMITELLELERLRERGGIRTELRELTPIVRDVVASLSDRAPGVRLVQSREPGPLALDADRVRLVIRNVLENAIKYSLPDSAPVEVSVSDRSDSVIVRITDDGPGIPAAEIGNLFEPFYRLDPSRSKKTGGYGLGLSICKRVMEAHGGSIAVQDRPGRGATFVLTFPKPKTNDPGK